MENLKIYFLLFSTAFVSLGAASDLVDISSSSELAMSSSDSERYFNILSLDGAGIENLVTVQVLSLIEDYAY